MNNDDTLFEWFADAVVLSALLQTEFAEVDPLHRYRRARARTEELNLAHRRGELVPMTDLEAGLKAWSARMRRAGDTLHKRFGRDAYLILDEAIDDADRALDQIFNPAGTDDAGQQNE